MKNTAKEILQRPYSRVLVPEDDGRFSARILEFPGCFSQGNSVTEAYANLEEAAASWVEASLDQKINIPDPFADQERFDAAVQVSSTTDAVTDVLLTEDERAHLVRLCTELEAREEAALRCQEGPEAQTRAFERAALRKLMELSADGAPSSGHREDADE